jgi:pimeloyl-ACP methyl ester carboxylesterase
MVRARSDTSYDDPLRAACPSTCPRLPHEADIGLRHRFIEANGVRFHVVEAGSDAGSETEAEHQLRPLVLLLHGFPEFWFGWRSQMPSLARHFRVAAPDLRGYNLSGKPSAGFDFEALARDVPSLVRALGADRAHLVGHDWGGMIAWGAATFFPEVVDRLTILNAPHPAVYMRELGRNPKQLLRSWYIALFQVRGLAEWLLTRGNGRGVADLLLGSTAYPHAFSATELAAYRRAMLRPGAARATLAYYRALWSTDRARLQRRLRPVAAPTLLIWGMNDVALVPDLTNALERWEPGVRVQRIVNAGHWVQHERPDLVNQLLLEHLRGQTVPVILPPSGPHPGSSAGSRPEPEPPRA